MFEEFCEMTATFKIATTILLGCAIYYKYFVITPETEGNKDNCYEYLHEYHPAVTNRQLKLSGEQFKAIKGNTFLHNHNDYYCVFYRQEGLCVSSI